MSSEPPTLLTIPTEIRIKILHLALYIPSRTHSLPNAISIFWPGAFHDPDKYKPPFYGTQHMSKLFVICRQLHDEFEEILFTRFIFSFPHYTRLTSVESFTNTISPRARGLLKEVMVGIFLDLGFDESEEFLRDWNARKIQPAREALQYMRVTFPGLKKVHLSLNFISGPLSGVLVPRRINEYADLVMDLVAIFAPTLEVILFNKDNQKCRKEITEVCQDRLTRLMLNTEAQPATQLQPKIGS